MDQNQTESGVVWYNYAPMEGVISSGTSVQVEISSPELRKQVVHTPFEIQYSNFTPVSSEQQSITLSNEVPSENPETIVVSSVTIDKSKQKIKTANGITRIPCQECDKTFSCNASLRDHIRLHTGEKPFVCSECGISFAQRSNLKLHKRVHTGERPYMCGICGKKFTRISHLPGHMRIHTGERPYSCASCSQSFLTAQALKNHSRIHSGERPYVCEHCDTSFGHSSSLSCHKKRCNGEKRKRGRPLGSCSNERKKFATRRSKTKKNKTIKKNKKRFKGKDNLEIEHNQADSVTLNDSSSIDTVIVSEESLPTHSKIPSINRDKSDVISLQVINMQLLDREVDDSEITRPNECAGISILPDNGHVLVTEDMVQAAADAAGLSNHTSDLHQEAAVTMTELQHGVLNLVHHNAAQDNFDAHS